MTERELAKILRKRYDSAGRNETALQVHLFGIDYGAEIKKNKYKIAHLVELAGLDHGYAAEVSKGVKLSGYVERIENRKEREK